jgi:hypothetical protein
MGKKEEWRVTFLEDYTSGYAITLTVDAKGSLRSSGLMLGIEQSSAKKIVDGIKHKNNDGRKKKASLC